jgi:hypothetical protein
MSGGEIIDLAIQVYRSIAKQVLQSSVVGVVLIASALLFLQIFFLPSIFNAGADGSSGEQFGEVIINLIIALIISAPLLLIGGAQVLSQTIELVSSHVHDKTDQPPLTHKAKSDRLGAMLQLMFGGLLVGLGPLFFGFLALGATMIVSERSVLGDGFATFLSIAVVLAFLISLLSVPAAVNYLTLAMPALVVERLDKKSIWKRVKALQRSSRHAPHPLGFSIILTFMMLFIGSSVFFGSMIAVEALSLTTVLGNLVGVGWKRELVEGIVSFIPLFLTVWLLTPLWATASTLHYFDRLVRVEAYDIHLLANEIKTPDTPPRRA